MSAGEPLERLRSLALAEGPPLADELADGPTSCVFGPLTGAGERSAAEPHDYATVAESIFEGYLLHYGDGRLIDTEDEDLRLLAGDFFYAYGLSELARLGDRDAIGDLSELIALCAQLSRDRPAGQAEVGSACWALTCLSVATGRWPGYQPAIASARQGNDRDGSAALAVARERAREAGLTLELERALIAFSSAAAAQLRQT